MESLTHEEFKQIAAELFKQDKTDKNAKDINNTQDPIETISDVKKYLAAKYNIPDKFSDRIAGETYSEMNSDAQELSKCFQNLQQAKIQPTHEKITQKCTIDDYLLNLWRY